MHLVNRVTKSIYGGVIICGMVAYIVTPAIAGAYTTTMLCHALPRLWGHLAALTLGYGLGIMPFERPLSRLLTTNPVLQRLLEGVMGTTSLIFGATMLAITACQCFSMRYSGDRTHYGAAALALSLSCLLSPRPRAPIPELHRVPGFEPNDLTAM